MTLTEDYEPLKGKRLEILGSDGTVKAGWKPPIDDQETVTAIPEDAIRQTR